MGNVNQLFFFSADGDAVCRDELEAPPPGLGCDRRYIMTLLSQDHVFRQRNHINYQCALNCIIVTYNREGLSRRTLITISYVVVPSFTSSDLEGEAFHTIQ